MKKSLLIISALVVVSLTSSILANSPVERGIYLGAQGGLGFNNNKDYSSKAYSDGSFIYKVGNNSGFVGRVFLGYDISNLFAIETGYSSFFNNAVMYYSNNSNVSVRTQSLDLYGKLKVSTIKNFDFYTKFGVGYLMSHLSSVHSGDKSRGNLNAAFGIGVDYKIASNIITNLEWSHIIGYHAIMHNYQPSTDVFMLGLRYKFDF